MDFPITEHEMSPRQPSASNPGRAGSGTHAGAFADLLSAERFSDMSEDPAFGDMYEELDALAAREDLTDEDPAYDDADDSAAEDDHEDNDAAGQHAEGVDDPDAALAGLRQSLTSGAILIGGNTGAGLDPSAAQSMVTHGVPAADVAVSPQDQFAGTTPASAANLADVRVANRRAHALQANANHVETVKGELAKAQGGTTDAGKAGAAKATTGPQEAAQPKSEAGRLDQAFRAAFPQNSNTPAATPAPHSTPAQTPLAAQGNLMADSLSSTSTGAGSGDGGDTSAQIQSNAERASNIAASKSAATRSPFTLPGSRPAEQVSVQIQNAARNGTDRISIRLSPAALGKVEVKLELSPDKTVQAIVTAEKPETLDMLERDARTLQRALEDAGLKTNSDSLSFERRDNGGASDTASNADHDAPNGTDRAGDTDNDDDSGQIDVELSSRRHHDGLLDVEV